MGGAANSEDGPDVTPGSEPFRGLRFSRRIRFLWGTGVPDPARVATRTNLPR